MRGIRIAFMVIGLLTIAEATPASAGEQAFDAVGLPDATPEKLALAKTLMRLVGVEDALKASFDAQRGQLMAAYSKATTLSQSEVTTLVDRFILPALRDHVDALVAMRAEVFASKFSVSDLNELAAFYTTPLGQKLAASSKWLATELAVAGGEWQSRVTGDAVDSFKKTRKPSPAPNESGKKS